MPTSEPSHSSANASRSRRAKSRRCAVQRVDAPHMRNDEPESQEPPQIVPFAPPIGAVDAAEQLRLHAEQLSTHLTVRQEELDHREAELNSRAAKLESDMRAARLWLNEHESDLAARGRELDKLQEILLKQQKAINESLAPSAGTTPKTLSPACGVLGDEELLLQKLDLESRQRKIEEAESRVSIAQVDIERIQEELLAERRAFQEEVVATRRQIAAEQQAARADVEHKRQAVQRRSEHVDQCRIALTQMHGELERVQRETLEVRLATEELWAQISGAAPPAEVTRSLGRIRARLAEHYRQADAELSQRQQQLEELRLQLTGHCEQLVGQKRQFEQWLAAWQEQTEQQATRLMAREEEVRREEARLQEEASGWRSERLKYQQEIRRLRAALAVRETAAVA